MLSLNLSIKQSLVLEPEYVGGATESIFVLFESKILSNKDNIKGVYDWLLHPLRIHMNRYESVMDWIFCNCFPEFRKLCFDFYKTNRYPLRDILNQKEVDMLDSFLGTMMFHQAKLIYPMVYPNYLTLQQSRFIINQTRIDSGLLGSKELVKNIIKCII